MKRQAPIRGEAVPLSELRGGQTKKRSQEAVRQLHKAARHEMLADMAERDGETHSAILERGDAKRARAEAETHLTRVGETGQLLEAAGEAGILDKGPQGMTLHPNICVALEYPNSIVVEASQRRMELAVQAEALEPALDAAVAGQAANSLDRMLLHQMGTAHVHAMKCFEMSMGLNLPGTGLPPTEQVRLLNAAARLMDVYQNGMLVLHRLRTGGKQTVTVKHVVVHQQVQVNEGGQAVIAGTVKQRRRGNRRRKNGRIAQPE
jgi:hypothetical protein